MYVTIEIKFPTCGDFLTLFCVLSLVSLHRFRDESGSFQPTSVADSQHTLFTRGRCQFPCQFKSMGCIHHQFIGWRRGWSGTIHCSRRLYPLWTHSQTSLFGNWNGTTSSGMCGMKFYDHFFTFLHKQSVWHSWRKIGQFWGKIPLTPGTTNWPFRLVFAVMAT